MTYGYIRVSTQTQADKGFGMDVQRAAILKYAADRGTAIDKWYADAGVSGTKQSRPALDEMLEGLAEGDVIVVSATSRLWRDIFAQGFVMKAIMHVKADIRSVDEPSFDVYKYMTDPENFMITGMLGMLDQWERLTIARKLARGRTVKAKGGDKPAGVTPYGYAYSAGGKRVEVDAAEAKHVKQIFKAASAGQSLSSIVAALEGEGALTRRGKPFSRQAVAAILHNAFYTGMLTHQGATIQGNHTAIISKAEFGRVTKQLERHQRHQP